MGTRSLGSQSTVLTVSVMGHISVSLIRFLRLDTCIYSCPVCISYSNNNTTRMFVALSSRPKSLREFSRFIWWIQTERRVAANPQTKPNESAKNWLLPSTSRIAIVIIIQPSDVLTTRPLRPVLYTDNVNVDGELVSLKSTPGQEHTQTHPFNGPFSRTTRVDRYQKGTTNLDFTEARDSEWQWPQLGICKSAPRSRQITTPAPQDSVFYRPDALPAAQPTASKHWKHRQVRSIMK